MKNVVLKQGEKGVLDYPDFRDQVIFGSLS